MTAKSGCIISLISYLFTSILFANRESKVSTASIQPDIRAHLRTIRLASERHLKGQPPKISSNPLDGKSFEQFYAKDYLFLYQAIGYYLIALGEGKQLSSLKQAQISLGQAVLNEEYAGSDIRMWKDKVSAELFLHQFQVGNYQHIITAFPKLSQSQQDNPENSACFLRSLAELNKTDEIRSFLARKSKLRRLISSHHLLTKPKIIQQRLNRAISSKPHRTYSNPSQVINRQLGEPAPQKPRTYRELRKKLFQLRKNSFTALPTDTETSLKASLIQCFNSSPENCFGTTQKKILKLVLLESSKQHPRFTHALVKRLWRLRKLGAARKLIEAMLPHFQNHPVYPDLSYDLARILEDQGSYQASRKILSSLCPKIKGHALEEACSSRRAWVSHRNRSKDWNKLFRKHIETYPTAPSSLSMKYLLIESTHKMPAIRSFIREHPLTYQALLLAHNHGWNRRKILSLMGSQFLEKDRLSSMTPVRGQELSKRLRHYREMKSLGLDQEAQDLLVTTPFDKAEKDSMFALLHEFENIAAHSEQTILGIRLFHHFPQDRYRLTWRSIFPEFMPKVTKQALAEQNSDFPWFVATSIIRQESAFNMDARSRVNAQGLMQLMPATARGVAKKIGLKNYNLLDGKDNIRLGVAYFSSLMKKYDNKIHLALSGYNAGPTTTDYWLSSRENLAPIEFIESIPYRETRNYIKHVLRNFYVYRLLENGTV